MDTRTDSEQYYPSNRSTAQQGPQLADKVDRISLGEVGESYTLKDVKQKVNQIVRAMAPAVSALIFTLTFAFTLAASAATVVLEDLPNTAPVVTNEEDAVAMAAVGALHTSLAHTIATAASASTNYIDGATNALKVQMAELRSADSNRIDTTYAKRSEIPAQPDLSPYALRSELPRNYLVESDIANFATRSWVEGQNYVKYGSSGGWELPEDVTSLTNAVKYYGDDGQPSPWLTYGWYFAGMASGAGWATRLSRVQGVENLDLYEYGNGEYRWASKNNNGPTNFFAYVSEIPAPSTPSAPETTATLRWRADGTACVVTVAAGGTLSADISGWTEGQAVMAIITLADGAGIEQGIELVGYGAWPVGVPFVACCYRIGLTVFVVPSTTL